MKSEMKCYSTNQSENHFVPAQCLQIQMRRDLISTISVMLRLVPVSDVDGASKVKMKKKTQD